MNREQDILSRLDELERFMTRHRVRAWADEFHPVRVEAGADSMQLRRRVLEMYRGSMGSSTDLSICRANGHDVDDEKAANADLERMVCTNCGWTRRSCKPHSTVAFGPRAHRMIAQGMLETAKLGNDGGSKVEMMATK